MPPAELVVKDATALRTWLRKHHTQTDGVTLVLAKKGTTAPTSLTYDQALDELLCFGWVDGTRRSRDDATYSILATPRRTRSIWSQRNVEIIARLREEGRMHAAGEAEVTRAQGDGRWEAAYSGQARSVVPDDLAAALKQNPAAASTFATLSSQNRYAILHRLMNVKRVETRARNLEKFVAMLERGETIHPQRKT